MRSLQATEVADLGYDMVLGNTFHLFIQPGAQQIAAMGGLQSSWRGGGRSSIQAALGSDVVLAFDECTPFNAGRDYTARAAERTHRWLDRCLDWRREHASAGQLFLGIVQGGEDEDLRVESARRVAGAEG